MEKHPNHKEGIQPESSEKSLAEFGSPSGSDEDNMSIGCISIDFLSKPVAGASYENSSQLQEEQYYEIPKMKPKKQMKETCSTKGVMEANSMQQAGDAVEIGMHTTENATDQSNPKATHLESVKMELLSEPKKKIAKICKQPQRKAAARERRARISQRLRTLQRLVPGGTTMDTASSLDRVIHYVNLLKLQVKSLEYLCHISDHNPVFPSFLQSALPSTYSPNSKIVDPLQISTVDGKTIEQPPYDAMNLLL